MASIPINSKVEVIHLSDETADPFYIGEIGTVIDHNANGQTGNTKADPLHIVQFDDGNTESYWFEELKLIK